ncbi:N-alpha-acetyltransferase 30 [Cololabis saira]|uniref:N-alpha-acetyltransferase 30 n=1 Tax=Cololabis saira TaxID=129043 RepID=UPI002AD2CA6B|nr:N-alpha-acetyltransferase 30 [Cololabis saira]
MATVPPGPSSAAAASPVPGAGAAFPRRGGAEPPPLLQRSVRRKQRGGHLDMQSPQVNGCSENGVSDFSRSEDGFGAGKQFEHAKPPRPPGGEPRDGGEESPAAPVEELAQLDLGQDIRYVRYESELQMPWIMRLITKDLSEPYSIYTYRYFIHNWPQLCFLLQSNI